MENLENNQIENLNEETAYRFLEYLCEPKQESKYEIYDKHKEDDSLEETLNYLRIEKEKWNCKVKKIIHKAVLGMLAVGGIGTTTLYMTLLNQSFISCISAITPALGYSFARLLNHKDHKSINTKFESKEYEYNIYGTKKELIKSGAFISLNGILIIVNMLFTIFLAIDSIFEKDSFVLIPIITNFFQGMILPFLINNSMNAKTKIDYILEKEETYQANHKYEYKYINEPPINDPREQQYL